MITIRRALSSDAVAIGAVHVASWRSTYPGILPDTYLARLSVPRQAAHYDHAIRAATRTAPGAVYVAVASGPDLPPGNTPRVVGFATAGPARQWQLGGRAMAEGEVETLYILDDWRERGIGRRLLRQTATHLAETGCNSAMVWVLSDNPSRWFYAHLGGREAAQAAVQVGGQRLAQTAFVWNPIDRLLDALPFT